MAASGGSGGTTSASGGGSTISQAFKIVSIDLATGDAKAVELPDGVVPAGIVHVGSGLLAFGGHASSAPSAGSYVVDLDGGTVEEGGPLPSPIQGSFGVLLSGADNAACTQDDDNNYLTGEVSWQILPPLPNGAVGATLVSLDTEIIAFGGAVDGTGVATVYALKHGESQWEDLADMPHACADNNAARRFAIDGETLYLAPCVGEAGVGAAPEQLMVFEWKDNLWAGVDVPAKDTQLAGLVGGAATLVSQDRVYVRNGDEWQASEEAPLPDGSLVTIVGDVLVAVSSDASGQVTWHTKTDALTGSWSSNFHYENLAKDAIAFGIAPGESTTPPPITHGNSPTTGSLELVIK